MKKPYKTYAVYDNSDNGCCVFIGNAEETAAFLGVTKEHIYTYNRYDKERKKGPPCRRYEVEEVKMKGGFDE